MKEIKISDEERELLLELLSSEQNSIEADRIVRLKQKSKSDSENKLSSIIQKLQPA